MVLEPRATSGARILHMEGCRGTLGEAEGGREESQAAPPHLGACAHSLPSAREAFLSGQLLRSQALILQIWAPGVQLLLLGKIPQGRDWLGPAWSQGQRYGRGWGQACPPGCWCWGAGWPSCLTCPCAGSHTAGMQWGGMARALGLPRF